MSQMADFIEKSNQKVESLEAKRVKQSFSPKKTHHRLAVNYSFETMKKLEDLMFERRMKSYKAVVVSLIEEAYAREVVGNE